MLLPYVSSRKGPFQQTLRDYSLLQGMGRRNRDGQATAVYRIEHALIAHPPIDVPVHHVPTPYVVRAWVIETDIHGVTVPCIAEGVFGHLP